MSEFKCGVVIPVGPGRRENLIEVLVSLNEQKLSTPKAVVLVHDGPEAYFEIEHGPGMYQMVIERHQPGREQPRNAGVRLLINKHPDLNAVWFLDSDVIVGPDTSDHFRQAWEAVDQERVLIGPYDWLPPGVRFADPNCENDPRWPMLRESRWDAGLGTSVGELNVGLGCFSGNLVWPIKEFTRVGGFWNEIHHGRCEDGELGLRAVALGVPITCVSHARGWHLYHEINHELAMQRNARDVPMLNTRHPWVEGEGVLVVERDGRRFEQVCGDCGVQVNTLDWWRHRVSAHPMDTMPVYDHVILPDDLV